MLIARIFKSYMKPIFFASQVLLAIPLSSTKDSGVLETLVALMKISVRDGAFSKYSQYPLLLHLS